jgi:two-component system, cell cycle sensor histidine kinase and response regulator CckA
LVPLSYVFPTTSTRETAFSHAPACIIQARAYKTAMVKGTGHDLVIMDLTIPGGMGGEEAIPELLKMDPKARALVSSGYAEDRVMKGFTDYGFIGTIAKPVDIHELADTVRNVLSTG